MKSDDLQSGVPDSDANESPTREAFLEERKRFLEDVRLFGDAATIQFCPPDMTIEKLKQGWPVFWKCMREALRVARQKDCPPGVDLEDGLMAMRKLEKMVRDSFRRLKRMESSAAKAASDKKRAAERAARDKERTGRSGSRTLRRGAEPIAEFEKRLEAQRQSRATYDKHRSRRPSGHRINARPVGIQGLCNRLIHPEGPEIRVTEAMFFVPATDEKPFAFVQELFDLRASIIAEDKNDARGVILKLAINSIYGKLAQSVGRKGEPPAFASPWMAAAITAGPRRKLIEAGLTAPDSIVCFATDGIVSTTPLDVFVPKSKTMGHWEHEEAKHGGVFIQSGVYAVIKDRTKGDKGVKIASRGFSPQNIGVSEEVSWTQAMLKVLFEDIPACWKEGKPAYVFERQQYMTVGASLARNPPPPVKGPGARRPWRPSLIGSWIKSEGKLQLDAMSRKRTVPRDPALRANRSEGLISLTVNQWPLGGHTESFPSRPKWMDPLWLGPEWTGVKEDQEEGVEKDYEGESEIDALDEQDDVIAGLSAG
jgi:hypothetical protein